MLSIARKKDSGVVALTSAGPDGSCYVDYGYVTDGKFRQARMLAHLPSTIDHERAARNWARALSVDFYQGDEDEREERKAEAESESD